MKNLRIFLILLSFNVMVAQEVAPKSTNFLQQQYKNFVDDLRLIKCYFTKSTRCPKATPKEVQWAAARTTLRGLTLIMLVKSVGKYNRIVSYIQVKRLPMAAREDFAKAVNEIHDVLDQGNIKDVVSIDLVDANTIALTVKDYGFLLKLGIGMHIDTKYEDGKRKADEGKIVELKSGEEKIGEVEIGKSKRAKIRLDKIVDILRNLKDLKITTLRIQRQRAGLERAIPWQESLVQIPIK